jgi:hypothetical protein
MADHSQTFVVETGQDAKKKNLCQSGFVDG